MSKVQAPREGRAIILRGEKQDKDDTFRRRETGRTSKGTFAREQEVAGDQIHITVEETQTYDDGTLLKRHDEYWVPRAVDYDRLRKLVSIEPDPYHEAPWDAMDMYEHDIIWASDFAGDSNSLRNALGFARSGGTSCLIVVHGGMNNYKQTKNYQNEFDYYRELGASKQVAAEMIANRVAADTAKIADWYNNGIEWWFVTCRIVRGDKSYEDTLAGVLGTEEYEDSAANVVDLVASYLEDDGYEIVNRPPTQRLKVVEFKQKLQRNKELFNWKSVS